ncbi:hypothetical protein BDY19DRAFT_908652 [Irpex rosettiformis]|uniref:Uncharacterized protein n=1 Tax=Irpex rosettiformis TaxID=378272 RepID=A0ACB8TV12_9APHY|nr:hypothetical protein BDY19DRAFT_908652 [Irpex rosettiformis]
MAAAYDLNVPYDLWSTHWGKPLALSQATWQDEQFDFFEPSKDLGGVFTVRLEERILVREEYRVAYDYFVTNANHKPTTGRSARYILTGSPGIGKTSFLAYALLRRLSEQKDTVVQLSSDAFVLFSSYTCGPTIFNGSRAVSAKGINHIWDIQPYDVQLLESKDFWVLSDGTTDSPVPCAALLKSSALVIHATRPASDRWDQWKEEQRAKLYVMDLWTEPELGALLSVLGLDVPRGISIAQKYGPCARTVVLLTSDPDEERYHLGRLKVAIDKFANSPFLYLEGLYELRVVDKDWTFSLFSLRPTAADKRGTAEIYIPTPALLAHIAERRSQVVNNRLLEILTALSQRSTMHVAAQWMVACYMHTWLSTPARNEIDMYCTTVSRLAGFPGLYARIPSCDKIFIGDLEELGQFECFYWNPMQGRPAGVDVDAFIYVKSVKVLWVFQATVDQESMQLQPMGEKLDFLLSELGRQSHKVVHRCLIFIGCHLGKSDWTARAEMLKNRYPSFEKISYAQIQIPLDDQKAIKLMQQCAASAPDFIGMYQTDVEE